MNKSVIYFSVYMVHGILQYNYVHHKLYSLAVTYISIFLILSKIKIKESSYTRKSPVSQANIVQRKIGPLVQFSIILGSIIILHKRK